jgi:hypothetical protein
MIELLLVETYILIGAILTAHCVFKLGAPRHWWQLPALFLFWPIVLAYVYLTDI